MARSSVELFYIILLHFGIVTFRFHHGRNRKPIIFMIWGFSDVSMTPKTNYDYLWRHQDTSNNQRKSQTTLKRYDLRIDHKIGSQFSKVLEKTGSGKS